MDVEERANLVFSRSLKKLDRRKVNILGIGVDVVDYSSATDRIAEAARLKQTYSVSALAVHGVVSGVLDKELGERINSLDMVCPDGQPVRWAMNLMGKAGLSDRVYGPTLTLRVCEMAAREGLGVFLFGSTDEVLSKLADNLKKRFPELRICGSQPSRFRQITDEERDQDLGTIRDSKASITLVGLGCPRQEVWVFEMADKLEMPCLAVGAAFDFHAGLLPMAPEWMQNTGLEWLYRLAQEPKRLWRRYLCLNTLYVFLIMAQILRLRKFAPRTRGAEPLPELRYG